MRVGIGYDIHRFDGTRPLKLGGVVVPSKRGLGGHSDADVLLHALTDALLGAVGAPDIGEMFPSDDPHWRNADSRRFIKRALEIVHGKGWVVGNVDATVVADAPKLTGHKGRIGRSISQMLGVEATQVSVKAKTTEGFMPSRSGIAAHAVVLLQAKARPRRRAAASRRR